MANENEEGSEKTEQPTSKRLSKSRNEGQVVKSMEVNSVAILITGVLLLFLYGGHIMDSLAHIMQVIILNSPKIKVDFFSVQTYFTGGLIYIIKLMLPFLLSIAFVGVVANVVQSGWLFTLKPLKLDLGKVMGQIFNIAGALKKLLITIDMIQKLLKDFLKFLVIGAVAYYSIKSEIMGFIPLISMSVEEIFTHAAHTLIIILIRILALLVVLAAGDFIYSKWKYIRDLKMTKQEVKEEVKQQDMPKEIKAKIAQKQVDVFLRGMMKEVPKADVVITNPIHVAVALKYSSEKMSSPIVAAKGLRLIADKIKKIAIENDIPIMENPPLARSLYKKVEVGREIPEEFFKAIAEVLAFVYRLNKEKE